MPVSLKGSTSGTVTLDAAAVAGVNTITVPAQTGTMITTASSAALPISALVTTGTPSASTYLAGNGAWQAVASNGQLIRAPQYLTSGTSYTTPANCTAIYVEAVGGGGGGGGAPTAGDVGGSGSSGAYVSKYFTVTANTAYTYAIGSAGTAGASAGNGTAGGNTTFTVVGTTITGTGGLGGQGSSTTAAKLTAPVTATGGDFNGTSDPGISLSALYMRAGSTIFGFGGTRTSQSSATTPSGYGSAGVGGTGVSGQAGAQGLIRIWEYT